jgi:hypothetical protein
VLKLVGWLSGDSRVPSLVWYVIVDETDDRMTGRLICHARDMIDIQ